MITLYQYQKAFGLPNASPFCMKVETFLRMAELDYQSVYIDSPHKAPKKKLPYIIDGNNTVADSGFILDYLTQRYNVQLDQGMSPQELATAHAFRAMLEERFYFALFWERWAVDSNWEVLRELYFGSLPFPLSTLLPPLIRRGALKAIRAQGMGRHSQAEIISLAHEDLKAVSVQLAEHDFLLGDHPRSIDAVSYAFLANVLIPELSSDIKKAALNYPNLSMYVTRMSEKYFGDRANV